MVNVVIIRFFVNIIYAKHYAVIGSFYHYLRNGCHRYFSVLIYYTEAREVVGYIGIIGTANGDHVALFNRKLIECPNNMSFVLLTKYKSRRHTVYANGNIGGVFGNHGRFDFIIFVVKVFFTLGALIVFNVAIFKEVSGFSPIQRSVFVFCFWNAYRFHLTVIRIKVLSASFAVIVSYNAFFLTGRFFSFYPYVVVFANGGIKHYQAYRILIRIEINGCALACGSYNAIFVDYSLASEPYVII